jgi:hypothetical protein
MYTRILSIVALIFFIAGISSGLGAQTGTVSENIDVMPVPIVVTTTLKVSGIELTDGVTGLDNRFQETIFGYGFMGQTSGDLPGSLMLSMNCYPAYFKEGTTNQVTGGMWTLPVYSRPRRGLSDVYMGSLYGTIVDGKMSWGAEGADMDLVFNIDGGTGTWDGASGRGEFTGRLLETKGGAAVLEGELTLTYGATTTK